MVVCSRQWLHQPTQTMVAIMTSTRLFIGRVAIGPNFVY